MDDSQTVYIADANDNLLDDVHGLQLLDVPQVVDEVEKVFSFDQLSYDIDMILRCNALFEERQQRVRHYGHYCALMSNYKQGYARILRDYSLNLYD